jgi:hypothetical protein
MAELPKDIDPYGVLGLSLLGATYHVRNPKILQAVFQK